jgi:hypothetical protein
MFPLREPERLPLEALANGESDGVIGRVADIVTAGVKLIHYTGRRTFPLSRASSRAGATIGDRGDRLGDRRGRIRTAPRPLELAWVRDIRDQCLAPASRSTSSSGTRKKAAGRFLDGRLWSEMPVVAAARRMAL